MADTTTANIGLTKPGVADPAGRNLWGDKWNLNADAIDAIFKSDGTGTSVGINIGAGKALKVAGTATFGTPVVGGAYAVYIENTDTSTNSQAILQMKSGTKYVNRVVYGVGGYMHELGSSITVRYSDFDTHYFRRPTGAGQFGFDGSGLFVSDVTDPTKNVRLDVSGVTTGTTRTLTVPNETGTIALASQVNPTGAVVAYVGSTAPSGWLLLRGGTIGNASSGATVRANADTVDLFTLLWNSMANTEAAVSGGRGASAAADYAANKTITLPDAGGRVIAGKEATASRLTTGVSGLDGATLGKAGGDQNPHSHSHDPGTLSTAGHNHSASGAGSVGNNLANGTSRAVGTADGVNSGYFQDVQVTVNGVGALAVNAGATAAQFSGASGNVQPTLVLNHIIKL